MTKVIKFTHNTPLKFGHQKVKKKKKKIDLEEFGQLNLFESTEEARIIKMGERHSLFEEALLLDDSEDERAREVYLKAIEDKDCLPDAYCNLGILESKSGDIAKAIKYLTLCLKEDSGHFEAHYNLANIYFEAGNYELAKMHYEVAIEIEPNFSFSYYNLGLVLAILNQTKEAIEVLNKYKDFANFEEKNNADELIRNLKKSIK
ncbi:MAG: tetratricopeptide repeat protein [Cyclobacteriaceae bacterium]